MKVVFPGHFSFFPEQDLKRSNAGQKRKEAPGLAQSEQPDQKHIIQQRVK